MNDDEDEPSDVDGYEHDADASEARKRDRVVRFIDDGASVDGDASDDEEDSAGVDAYEEEDSVWLVRRKTVLFLPMSIEDVNVTVPSAPTPRWNDTWNHYPVCLFVCVSLFVFAIFFFVFLISLLFHVFFQL